MQRIINVEYYDRYDCAHNGDASVEFTQYDEDGKIVNEIIQVFLPEYVPEEDRKALKESVTELFHKGEGYNL